MAFPDRNDPTRRNARFEREVDNPFTRPQTARASFHPPDRNQSRPAHQIASGMSYVSAHPSPKHLDRKAAPAQPAFRTPDISRIAHQAASGTPTPRPPSRKRHADATPAKPLAAYPTPCQPNLQLHVHQTPMSLPPGLSHFPEKAAALFHVEGKTRERRRVRNASPAGKGAQLYEVKG